MELRQYWSVVWKWMWLIILSTGIAAGASFLATIQQPKIYQATATLLVGQSIQSSDPNSQDIYTSQQLALTYIQVARMSPVLQGAIDTLGLNATPDQLRANMNASIVQGTQLIELKTIDTDPARAQALANELARQLTLQGPAAKANEQAQRNAFVQQQIDELQKKIEDGQKAIDDLQSSIQVTASAREIADKQNQIGSLQNQINTWRQSYATLLASAGVGSPNYITIMEPARVPTTPIAPNVPQTVLLATAIGLALAVGAAFLIEYIDDTVKTPDDITALKLTPLGFVARIEGASPADKLVTALHPRSSHAEAFRVLRTNIQVTDVDRPIKTILVTSPNPSEGKSMMAANLAVVMAQAGLRTVLVDADMRRPIQHTLFHVTRDYGLTDGLRQSVFSQDGFVQPSTIENLRLITTGQLPPNPAELLGSKRMQSMIEYLKADADVIIFDSPPCLALADPAVLAKQVDGVILVLDAGNTRRESANRAKDVLERSGGRILGVLLNRISPRGDGYSYYYYSYYYYSQDGTRKKHSRDQGIGGLVHRTFDRSAKRQSVEHNDG